MKTRKSDWPGQNTLGNMLMAMRTLAIEDPDHVHLVEPVTVAANESAAGIAIALLDRVMDSNSSTLSSPELLSKADTVISQLTTSKSKTHRDETSTDEDSPQTPQIKRKVISPLPDEEKKRVGNHSELGKISQFFQRTFSPKTDV